MKTQTKYKQIETSKIPEGWEELILSEAIEINPKRNISKGSISKFVSMGDVKEFNKKIQGFTKREYTGGTKFINGDTIMARITPCLENGKTAFVDMFDKDEVGAGSTEFIVLSEKKEKTINQFVYYLSISPEIRKQAIKSMTGTSGRQRVETDIFSNIIVNLPSFPEQCSIAKILSDLDEKIELNNKMNETLESIAQAIFKHWFVDFEFPNEQGNPYKSSGGKMVGSELGKIPGEWRVGKLGDYIEFVKGKKPKDTSEIFIEGYKPQILIENLDGKSSLYANPAGMINVVKNEPIMVMDGASSGRIEIGCEGILGSTLAKINPKTQDISNMCLYHFLKINEQDINQNTTGTSIPHVDKKKIQNYYFVIPNQLILKLFDKIANCIINRIIVNRQEIIKLSQIRDSLLPKLISGKIRVET